MMHLYKVTLRLKNEVGVLARVTTLLRKFQVNILSLDAAPVDEEGRFHVMHMILESPKDPEEMSIVTKKLKKLIPVVEVSTEKQ